GGRDGGDGCNGNGIERSDVRGDRERGVGGDSRDRLFGLAQPDRWVWRVRGVGAGDVECRTDRDLGSWGAGRREHGSRAWDGDRDVRFGWDLYEHLWAEPRGDLSGTGPDGDLCRGPVAGTRCVNA